MKTCSVRNCVRKYYAKGFCNPHYSRYRSEKGLQPNKKIEKRESHGHRDSPTYKIWSGMKQRCLNPRNKSFAKYGAKGISVCRRWLTFKNFLNDMGVRPPGKTLDRIKGKRGYSPGNCRWASYTEQNRNLPQNIFNEKLVSEIRNLYFLGWRQADIARKFKKDRSAIGKIILKKAWK